LLELSLPEALVVLGIEADQGTTRDRLTLSYAIAGADRPHTPGHWVMKRRSAGLAVYARRLVATGVVRAARAAGCWASSRARSFRSSMPEHASGRSRRSSPR